MYNNMFIALFLVVYILKIFLKGQRLHLQELRAAFCGVSNTSIVAELVLSQLSFNFPLSITSHLRYKTAFCSSVKFGKTGDSPFLFNTAWPFPSAVQVTCTD